MQDKLLPTRVIFNGVQDYQTTYQEMREYTSQRSSETIDQIWILQHNPVYTIGTNNADDSRLESAIPMIKSDRGGQMTYHGPGQLIIYYLLDLQRRKLGIRRLVESLEQAIISLLKQYAINANRKDGFPGVYVSDSKIASVGLRVRNGCSYHGISLNVNMDLSPFDDIVICGQPEMKATQVSSLGGPDNCEQLALPILHLLNRSLDLNIALETRTL